MLPPGMWYKFVNFWRENDQPTRLRQRQTLLVPQAAHNLKTLGAAFVFLTTENRWPQAGMLHGARSTALGVDSVHLLFELQIDNFWADSSVSGSNN